MIDSTGDNLLKSGGGGEVLRRASKK